MLDLLYPSWWVTIQLLSEWNRPLSTNNEHQTSHNCKHTSWQRNIYYFNHKDFWISLKALVFHIQACHPRFESFWALVSQICRCYIHSILLWSVQHWENHQQVDETLFEPVLQKHWIVSTGKLSTQSTGKW